MKNIGEKNEDKSMKNTCYSNLFDIIVIFKHLFVLSFSDQIPDNTAYFEEMHLSTFCENKDIPFQFPAKTA